MTATLIAMRCPQCHERGSVPYADYMRGRRPMCDYCGKTRMISAVEHDLRFETPAQNLEESQDG